MLSGDRLLQQGQAPVDLRAGLPDSREKWSAFDALILGNASVQELPIPVQQSLLGWIARDGGGLVYAGGAGSHRAMRGTRLGDVLPIDPGDGSELEGPLAVHGEVAALEHPLTRGLLQFFVARGDRQPLLLDEAFIGGERRAGAEVLLSVSAPLAAEPRRHPLLAVRQYGSGRIVTWLTESDWRWVMRQPRGDGERLFDVLWGRMARWAARRDAGLGKEETLELSKTSARVGEEVTLTAYGGERLWSTSVLVRDPGGGLSSVSGKFDPDRDRWVGRFAPQVAGVHILERRSASATGQVTPDGETAGEAQVVLIVHPDSRELEDTAPDWDLLRLLADRTGGHFFTLAEAGALYERIVRDRPGLVTQVELGTERSWPLFAALLVLLTLEWALRRRLFVI
jgi:uncharacterized membrane protein